MSLATLIARIAAGETTDESKRSISPILAVTS